MKASRTSYNSRYMICHRRDPSGTGFASTVLRTQVSKDMGYVSDCTLLKLNHFPYRRDVMNKLSPTNHKSDRIMQSLVSSSAWQETPLSIDGEECPSLPQTSFSFFNLHFHQNMLKQ